jgi:hypothetical protein
MRLFSYLTLLLLICSYAYSQNIETITKSKTVILPQDYAAGIPEYYIPDGYLASITRIDGDVRLFLSKTSFLSKTNNPQVFSLEQWNQDASNNFKGDNGGGSDLSYYDKHAQVSGPLYLKILPQDYRYASTDTSVIDLKIESQVHVGVSTNNSIANPNTAVVIPSTVNGDVEVVLEQSQDGVTWTQCLPGTYNASTVKRFFRLRAVEK